MRRGFTLLELVVVLIILGILATLGFSQYTRMIERARGAEARQVLGAIRMQAAGVWMENRDGDGALLASILVNSAVGIGTTINLIPESCSAVENAQYYFSYGISQLANNKGFTATATRCTASGKAPAVSGSHTLTLETDFVAGTNKWEGTAGDYR